MKLKGTTLIIGIALLIWGASAPLWCMALASIDPQISQITQIDDAGVSAPLRSMALASPIVSPCASSASLTADTLKQAPEIAHLNETLTLGEGLIEAFSSTGESELQVGWNLVSVPIIPDDTSIAQVLSSIDGHYDLVYSYDASSDVWLSYNPSVPESATLLELNEQTAFWIRMSQEGTLAVAGTMPNSTEQQLYAGWNLVAYPAMESRQVAHALESISGLYSLIYRYETGATIPWRRYSSDTPSWANSLTHFDPGLGYWVHVSQNCVLSIASGKERFGVSVNGPLAEYDYAHLGLGWHHNWSNIDWTPIGDTFFATAGAFGKTVATEGPQIADRIAQYPERYPDGLVWFIGNEIGWDDKFTPAQYAQHYHDWHAYLKGLNSTFQIGTGALLPIFPGYWNGLTGIQWLSEVRTQYQSIYDSEMPVDYYNMHVYFLYEDEVEFYETIEAMRQAMAAQWDARAKPMVITEAGQLYDNASPTTIRRRMADAFDYFLSATSEEYGCTSDYNRVVQRWAWFSLTGWSSEEGNHRWDYTALFDYDTKGILPLGETYASYTNTYHNITP